MGYGDGRMMETDDFEAQNEFEMRPKFLPPALLQRSGFPPWACESTPFFNDYRRAETRRSSNGYAGHDAEVRHTHFIRHSGTAS
jgi:hypothetical protein